MNFPEKDDATVIVDSTMSLIHSLSCPASSLRFARRLMSSTIGSTYGQNHQDRWNHQHSKTILKKVRRSYERKYYARMEEKDKNENSHLSYDDNFKKASMEQHCNELMQKVECLFDKMQRIDYDNDRSWKWMILFSKLAGTCRRQDFVEQQRKNLRYLQTKKMTENEKLNGSPVKAFGDRFEFSNNYDQSEPIPIQQKVAENSKILHEQAKEKSTFYKSNKLLRECIFALQGIDGESLRFLKHDAENDGIPYQEGVRVLPGVCSQISNNPTMIMDAIRICGECGWLYLRIQAFINLQHAKTGSNYASDGGSGVISRALCAALSKELSEYHRLLAMFESQIEYPSKISEHSKKPPLTLRRLIVWLREPTQRLQVLATIADGVRGFIGGQLADALHLHATNNGDPVTKSLLYNIVSASTVPFYRMLRNWVIDGILPNDTCKEFYVIECSNFQIVHGEDENQSYHYDWNSNVSNEKKNVWEGKYDLNLNMLPRFIGEELAYESFVVGKGINFIRICLDNPSWALSLYGEAQSTTSSNISKSQDDSNSQCLSPQSLEISFQYGNEHILFQTLRFASRQIHSHILSSLVGSNHNLMDHLLGLKRILLLGQGDFVGALLDGIQFELNKPASRVYIHNLNAVFDNALRSTNARYLPSYVLDKVQVKLMKKQDVMLFSEDLESNALSKEEETGWDVFSLDYNVQAPLSAIVHSHAIKQYRRVFHLLWKLKQIEWALNKSWKRANFLNHALWQYLGQYTTTKNIRKSGKPAKILLNKAATTRRAMLHFVSNLQSYLLFEVIEGGWKSLIQEIERVQSLDDLIEAHDTYLSDICNKSLLGRNSNGSLALQLARVFEKCSEFCTWQDGALEKASNILHETRLKKEEAERRTAAGLWGYEMKEGEVDDDERFFDSLTNPENIKAVNIISSEFNTVLMELLDMLNNEINSTATPFKEPLSRMDQSRSPRRSNTIHKLSYKYRFKRHSHMKDAPSVCERDEALRFLAFQLDFSEYYSKGTT